MFNQSVIENLDYYVYFLLDPRDNEIFYVGKGKGNRVFNHVECAAEGNSETEKLDRIRDIISSGNTVKHFILRHGLTESTAFEVEAALIDFVGIGKLANFQSGHYSGDYGLKSTDEISAIYNADELSTNRPVVLINLNRLYHRRMTDKELYEATRKAWVIGPRREKAEYAIATYRGLTREVYRIESWYAIEGDKKTRWGFNGNLASDDVREALRYKSIAPFFKKGAANPIRYVNC